MKKLIWKLAGRFLTRRLVKKAVKYARELEEENEDDLDLFRVAVGGNPGLHARIMLQGQHFRHYLLPEDMARMVEAAQDEPEYKCRWN